MNEGIKDLLIDELHDLLSAENQIIKALPAMIKAADSPRLKEAITTHLIETKGQVERLAKIFNLLKVVKKEKFCQAAKGLIQECDEVIKKYKKSFLRDAALIAKAQRIEHYEIAAYGTVRTFANELGLGQIADLLNDTLMEEENADTTLTKIAEGSFFSVGINRKANIPQEQKAVAKKVVKKKAVPAPKKAAPVPMKAKKAVKATAAKRPVALTRK